MTVSSIYQQNIHFNSAAYQIKKIEESKWKSKILITISNKITSKRPLQSTIILSMCAQSHIPIYQCIGLLEYFAIAFKLIHFSTVVYCTRFTAYFILYQCVCVQCEIENGVENTHIEYFIYRKLKFGHWKNRYNI